MHQIELISGLSGLRSRHRGCVATIGAFDGVHRGHQALLQQTIEQAKTRALPSVVIVFEPQPNEFFNAEDDVPARLMRLREKCIAFQRAGIDSLLCLRFDSTMRGLSAEAFVRRVLVDGLGIEHLTVGDDFRFGANREGDYRVLKTLAVEHGFEVSDTSTCTQEASRISSTRIRALLAEAKLDEAAALLGMPYSNIARVIYGKQLGRKLGFPTLNFHLGRRRVPLSGVYTVEVWHGEQRYQGVANVGVRPSVESGSNSEGTQRLKPILEVHLLDVKVELYGEFLEVRYLKKLRDERRFESLALLSQQIEKDVTRAREYFKSLA